MDLSAIKPLDGVPVEITLPDGTPVGLRITTLSNHDPRVKAAAAGYMQRVQAAQRRGKTLTVAQQREGDIDICLAAVTGWEWHGDGNWRGETPAYGEDIAREVLAIDWIRSQIGAQMDADADFFRTPPSPSRKRSG